MKRLIGYTAIVMATLMALVVMWQFRSVIILFLISVAVAAMVRPLIRRSTKLGLPHSISTALVYLLWLLLIVAAALLAGRQLLGAFQTLTDRLATSYEMIYPEWESGTPFQQAAAGQLPPPEEFYESLTGPGIGSLGQRVLGLSRGTLSLAAGFFVVLSLSLYWTLDHRRFERLWLSLLPVRYRARTRDTWQAVEVAVGAYLRGIFLQSLLGLLILGLGYWALNLEFPLTLAILGAALALIPVVGALIAALPVFLVGMAAGPVAAAVAAVFTVAVLWLLELYVRPRFLCRRSNNAILTVVLMLVLIREYGFLGLAAAPVLAVAIQSLAAYLFNQAQVRESQAPVEKLDQQRARLEAVAESNSQEGAVDRPEIDSLSHRLADLLERADRIMPPAKASQ